MPCTVVVGAPWGDEGMRKFVDAFSEAADVEPLGAPGVRGKVGA